MGEARVKRILLVQVGVGLIGGTTIRMVIEHRASWREKFAIDVGYASLIDIDGAIVAEDVTGLSDEQLLTALDARKRRASMADIASSGGHHLFDGAAAINEVAAMGPFIVADTAAGSATVGLAARTLDLKGGMIFSNKSPFALPMGDTGGDAIWDAANNGTVRYETTCGAGLPVISTLRSLLDTGDEVIEIVGALSGTLGAIFSDVAAGEPFSAAVRSAKELGYTEPDPRDDLSGLDVARKALILARTIGRRIDLTDIEIESLVPEALRVVDVSDYLNRVTEQDAEMAARAAAATADGKTLKYVAQVRPEGRIAVGIRAISTSTVLGALQGPENIISFRTKRYDDYPMNITGPGAGAAVTAAGLVADMLALATGPIGA
jgi:homoserine dehydrogenase